MTNNKILGQAYPTAATPTVCYTVPALKQANINLFICNLSGSTVDTIRVALVPYASTLSVSQYIAYGLSVGQNQTVNITGISLNAGDEIFVYSTNGTCAFNATGIEISPNV